MGSDASRGSTNLSRRRREGDIRKGLASNGCEPKGWRYIGFYERNPHHRKALVLPLFRFSPSYSLSFGTIYPPPLVLAFLVLSPSRASASLTDSPGRVSLQSEFQYIGMRPKWWNTNTVYYPIVLGSEIWMSCYEIGDGWASEWKAEIAGNLLPASSSTTLPTPSPSPSLLYRALIQTRFVNIDVCFALRGCKSSLPLSLLFRIPLDLLFQRRSSPAPIEGWPGCSNLPPASRKPKLVGWLFLFSADYGRSLVAGIPSGDKFVRLSEPRAHPIRPCLNGYVLPPLSRGERSHDKFQRSR